MTTRGRLLMKTAGVAAVCAGAFLSGALGCASNVEVTQAFTPKAAAAISRGQMTPVAVIRGQERIAIPATARVEADRVVLSGVHVHRLGPNDVIQKDDQGRIVGVRTGGEPPVIVRFVPGTATSPEDSEEVTGQLADKDSSIPLTATDRIEMTGSFGPDDKIPGGAHVETKRSTSMLVTGIVLLGLSYLPTAYVGIMSSRASDRVLLAPVVGPWINLAGRDKCVPPAGSEVLPVDACLPETASRVMLYLSGGVQLLAAVVGAFGLPARAEVVYASDRGVARTPPKPTFTIVPFTNLYGGGAAAIGTF